MGKHRIPSVDLSLIKSRLVSQSFVDLPADFERVNGLL